MTLTLTYDLVSRKIMSGAYCLYNLVWIPLGMAEWCIPFSGHCDLDIGF